VTSATIKVKSKTALPKSVCAPISASAKVNGVVRVRPGTQLGVGASPAMLKMDRSGTKLTPLSSWCPAAEGDGGAAACLTGIVSPRHKGLPQTCQKKFEKTPLHPACSENVSYSSSSRSLSHHDVLRCGGFENLVRSNPARASPFSPWAFLTGSEQPVPISFRPESDQAVPRRLGLSTPATKENSSRPAGGSNEHVPIALSSSLRVCPLGQNQPLPIQSGLPYLQSGGRLQRRRSGLVYPPALAGHLSSLPCLATKRSPSRTPD
jgi:hypothetical protein